MLRASSYGSALAKQLERAKKPSDWRTTWHRDHSTGRECLRVACWNSNKTHNKFMQGTRHTRTTMKRCCT